MLISAHLDVVEVHGDRVRSLDAHLFLGWAVRHSAKVPLHYERRHLVLGGAVRKGDRGLEGRD